MLFVTKYSLSPLILNLPDQKRGLRVTEQTFPEYLNVIVAELVFPFMNGIQKSGGRVMPLGSRLVSQI